MGEGESRVSICKGAIVDCVLGLMQHTQELTFYRVLIDRIYPDTVGKASESTRKNNAFGVQFWN